LISATVMRLRGDVVAKAHQRPAAQADHCQLARRRAATGRPSWFGVIHLQRRLLLFMRLCNWSSEKNSDLALSSNTNGCC
jgi:hypothetical protein